MTQALTLVQRATLWQAARMPQPDQGEDLVGSAEAARMLKRSVITVHRMAKDGRLPVAFTAPIGEHGAYFFRRADVERLIKERAA